MSRTPGRVKDDMPLHCAGLSYRRVSGGTLKALP